MREVPLVEGGVRSESGIDNPGLNLAVRIIRPPQAEIGSLLRGEALRGTSLIRKRSPP